MAPQFHATLFLPDETATTRLGAELAPLLDAGDTLLLIGPVGAGKSHLSRAIIQSSLGFAEDVPSPTYTLVQTYEAPRAEIWHADLYRLGGTSELAELGLEEAFENAICLIEWADRLGDDAPKDALKIVITSKGEGREVSFSSSNARWSKVNRAMERTAFLISAHWAGAVTEGVAGDLSSRSYQRLSEGQNTAILMDAGDDVVSTTNFVSMTEWLRDAGLSAPKILESGANSGLLLLEDFGDERLSGRSDVDDRMQDCLALLANVRDQKPPSTLHCPTSAELAEMTSLARHYAGADSEAFRDFRRQLEPLLENVITNVKLTVSLRDFHTDNIMWLGDREGIRRLGLLDYQDAFVTHPVYDLVSLLTDARRVVSAQTREKLISDYAKLTGDDLEALSVAFAIFSAQRNLRILGIFARAAVELDKPHHVPNIPRVFGYLTEALHHPVFEGIGPQLLNALPAPDAAFLESLAA